MGSCLELSKGELSMSQEPQGGWIFCEKCGKKLLRRKPNGIFVFKFGKNNNQENVVHIEIFGSIKMKCFREDCQYENIISFFPSGVVTE